jgi:protein gp37
MAARFSDPGQPFHGFAERTHSGPRWTGRVEVLWPMLDQPLRWRRPRRIFVNSMSDFFHPSIPREELATIYGVMVAAVHLRGHIFQILTKRPEHMRAVLTDPEFWDQVNSGARLHVLESTDPLDSHSGDPRATLNDYCPENAPPGIWLGTSVEDQTTADARIPELLATPAALRFLSCEPMLGLVDLHSHLCRETGSCPSCPACLGGIDWIIAGGESGPGARPMHPYWPRSLRDQCAARGIPFFFKQWGEWTPGENVTRGRGWVSGAKWFGGRWLFEPQDLSRDDICYDEEPDLYRVGKRAAGAKLDGREWREMPT